MIIDSEGKTIPVTPYLGLWVDEQKTLDQHFDVGIALRDRYRLAFNSGQLLFLLPPSNAERNSSMRMSVYNGIKEEIDGLGQFPLEDDLGAVRPTEKAIGLAKKILFRMMTASSEPLQIPDISTDGNADIRIEWEKQGRFLELISPSNPARAPYFYFSEG